MKILQFTICLLLCAGAVRAAADNAPLSDVIRTLDDSYTGVRRITLDNGMTVLIKESHRAPAVSVQVWVGTGAVHEDHYLGAGLSHYIEHMIFKGTTNLSPTDISREIDEAGGYINAYTTYDRTVFHADMPSSRWATGLVVIADALTRPLFPEEEWEKEKEVILREMAMGYDDPERVIQKLHAAAAYRVHPFRHPVIGYEDVFRTLTRDDLLAFFERHYRPDNMTLVIAGDVDPRRAEQLAREQFGAFKRRAAPPVTVPPEPPQTAPRQIRETGPYAVTRMRWSYHTVALTHPDTPALDVLAIVAGQGRSARLNRALKEDRQLVYSVSAWSYTPQDPGLFAMSAQFDPANEETVIDTLQTLIADWRNNPSFTEEELEKARRKIIASELEQLETASGLAGSLASGEFYAGDPAFSLRYLDAVARVSTADLARVTRRYLTDNNRTIALLAPASADAPEQAAAPPAAAVAPPERITLNNGAVLLIKPDHSLPLVSFSAVLQGGLLSENEENNGITKMMSRLLTRGAAARSREEIAEFVDRSGGRLDAFAWRSVWGMTARCLPDDRAPFMALLADCLLQPTFPEEEVEKARADQLAAVRTQREQPMFIAMQALKEALYPGHPYRWDENGTAETVQAIRRDDLIRHHETLTRSGNLVLSIAGDVNPDEIKTLAAEAFGNMPRGAAPPMAHPEADVDTARITNHMPRAQAVLLSGYPGVAADDPRADALQMIAAALNGLASELNVELREKRGLVYYAGAMNQVGSEPGLFALYAGTTPPAVPEAKRIMRDQIERLLRDGLRPEEIQRARAKIIGSFKMGLQKNQTIATQSAVSEILGLGAEHYFRTEERFHAVTPENIRDAARALFRSDRHIVSVVIPEQP